MTTNNQPSRFILLTKRKTRTEAKEKAKTKTKTKNVVGKSVVCIDQGVCV